jgi:cytidylate kinase
MAVVTISRQFGAGGLTLGRMISKKMGYTLFDNEILQLVAEKANVSTQWVESMEKNVGKPFQKIVTNLVSKSLVDRVIAKEYGYIDEEIYVDSLRTIITKIADEDNAVIVGRGGQYILKDRKDAVHALLIGERDRRVEFIEKKYKLSYKQASNLVDSEEKRRGNLYRKFGLEDYDQPQLYHMVLNMGRIDLETARDLICQLI